MKCERPAICALRLTPRRRRAQQGVGCNGLAIFVCSVRLQWCAAAVPTLQCPTAARRAAACALTSRTSHCSPAPRMSPARSPKTRGSKPRRRTRVRSPGSIRRPSFLSNHRRRPTAKAEAKGGKGGSWSAHRVGHAGATLVHLEAMPARRARGPRRRFARLRLRAEVGGFRSIAGARSGRLLARTPCAHVGLVLQRACRGRPLGVIWEHEPMRDAHGGDIHRRTGTAAIDRSTCRHCDTAALNSAALASSSYAPVSSAPPPAMSLRL